MIELRPCKDLLDPHFDGYKLSLEGVPIYRLNLECDTDHVIPSDDQYSLLHLKLFGLHNHLYQDPWRDDGMYYIDKSWKVQRIVSDSNTGRLEGTKEVFQMHHCQSRRPGHYNPSLSFPGEEIAVLSDGAGNLYILQTESRLKDLQWKVLFRGEVCGEQKPFVICDSRAVVSEGQKEIHTVLLHIDETEKDGNERSAGCFDTYLEWITCAEGENECWSVRSVRQLSAPGEVNYIALEPGCCALYLASEYPFKFVMDSENPIVKEIQDNYEDKQEKKEYMWQQTAEDIMLTFRMPENVEKSDITVTVKDLNVHIAYRDKVLLEGAVSHHLDDCLTTWAVERGKLEVNLVKTESGLMWSELVVGNTKGEQILDPALVEEVHERLAHLCSSEEVKEGGCTPGFNSAQLEDCDAPPNTMAVLARLDPITHKASHQVSLGGLQWLLNTPRSMEQVSVICLRHDVDGCVWQPGIPEMGKNDWPFTHIGTFMAFGYVQASKQQRKFSICPSDLSYVAICEAVSHVYIYRQPQALESEVRNRRTGLRVSHTARQQLVNLDTNQEVLGIHATTQMLYILTSDKVLALRINV